MVTPEELKFSRNIASKSGILLDPVYGAKAAQGLWEELSHDVKEREPGRKIFRGNRILFIQTGGVFSWFDDCIQEDFNRTFPFKGNEREE